MKICPIENIQNESFNPIYINALRQAWRDTRIFSCIGEPKKQNLLLLLCGCKITYTDPYGNNITAESGDVVYTPHGSEYIASLSDFQDSASHTVGINFLLFDELCEELVLSDGIQIFKGRGDGEISRLFERAASHTPTGSYLERRILLMRIISSLADGKKSLTVPRRIRCAISYIEEHTEENPTVTELSRLSGISEVYLRREFKFYTGMTPSEYRNKARLAAARAYLECGDLSVQEISDRLGYSTVSHFIKQFGREYGISPHKYKKLSREI